MDCSEGVHEYKIGLLCAAVMGVHEFIICLLCAAVMGVHEFRISHHEYDIFFQLSVFNSLLILTCVAWRKYCMDHDKAINTTVFFICVISNHCLLKVICKM